MKKEEQKEQEVGSMEQEKKTRTIEEIIYDMTIGAKNKALERIDESLAGLEKQKLSPQGMNSKKYEETKKEILRAREKIAKQNLEVQAIAIVAQLNNRTVANIYSNDLKVGKKVYPGFSYDELYGVFSALIFNLQFLKLSSFMLAHKDDSLNKLMTSQGYFINEIFAKLNNMLIAKPGVISGPTIFPGT